LSRGLSQKTQSSRRFSLELDKKKSVALGAQESFAVAQEKQTDQQRGYFARQNGGALGFGHW
jgi:hypothetical protein